MANHGTGFFLLFMVAKERQTDRQTETDRQKTFATINKKIAATINKKIKPVPSWMANHFKGRKAKKEQKHIIGRKAQRGQNI